MLTLLYRWGCYTITRGDVEARCCDAVEVHDMLMFLGMSDDLAYLALVIVNNFPGVPQTFSYIE